MVPMIRTACIALAALIAATPALAQDPTPSSSGIAAARRPNSFDRPAGAANAPVPVAAAATPSPATAAPTAPVDERSEGLLRTLIAGAQGDGMDYSLMTDALAEQIRPQADTINPLLRSLGTVQAVDWVGSGDDVDLFIVVFATGPSQWLIGVTDEGKVSALRFRPVPREGTAAPSPAPGAAPSGG